MAATAPNKRKTQQRQATIRMVIMVAIIVAVNIIASRFHGGLDLTTDKRYTLSPATKKMLNDLDGVAVITVYLQGDNLPAVWKRLQEATREQLRSFKDYAGNKIVYRFVDPFAGKDDNEQAAIYKQLYDKGISFYPVQVGDNQSMTEQKVFAFALVNFNGREQAVALTENHTGMDDFGKLNYAESLLEYKLANAIHRLTMPDKPRVAYITGHGEPLGIQTFDMLRTLSKYYYVDTLDLTQQYYIPQPEALIIINKPTKPFDDKEKFKIDQYVMNGGHVLWAIDQLNIPMDTLMRSPQYMAMDYGLNLDDILFKYGVRINPDLIEDRQCNIIPIVVPGEDGDKPNLVPREWPLLPVFTPESHHPIVNNMDAIKGMMANSIDTIANPEIRKTILLASSKYSRTTPSPVRINISMLMQQAQQQYEQFNNPYRPVAVLLEGRFGSIFRNRLHPEFMRILQDSLKRPFKTVADSAGSMIVVSDGDMFLNDFSNSTGPLTMGDWQYSRPPERYANKYFFLNCVEYLTDQHTLLEARSKSAKLRLLDPDRVAKEKATWQWLNVLFPVVFVLVFASAYLFFRKRRYEQKA